MSSDDDLSNWAKKGLQAKVKQAQAYVKSATNDAILLKELDETETQLNNKITDFNSGLL